MRRYLTFKGILATLAVAALLAGGVAYAAHNAFNRAITATWTVAISGDEPIQVYEADGFTPVTEIDFGVTTLDFFGNGPTPTHPVIVKNHSNTLVQVIVSGDLRDDVLPLFGPNPGGPGGGPG